MELNIKIYTEIYDQYLVYFIYYVRFLDIAAENTRRNDNSFFWEQSSKKIHGPIFVVQINEQWNSHNDELQVQFQKSYRVREITKRWLIMWMGHV